MAVIECPHCGAPVHVDEPSTVRSGHSASAGEPRDWIMREGPDEIHRCPDAA
ncbi:MAG: hypothetical protein QOF59_1473 [Actinomycetota bacterium]|jgi:hypothetical protein|nr:hypothetical protein [Actinomycetota bacterium]MDQ1476100.1 hypothetical protein [Actinomycetota bacterium]